MISSYLEFRGYSAVPDGTVRYRNRICRTQFSKGRQTRPKHHTYKNHKSKLKTQPEKLVNVSKVISCCFILSFQGLEDSKGFINGIISTIIRYFCSYVARGLSRWFAQTRARGVRITHKRSIFCSENTGHNY